MATDEVLKAVQLVVAGAQVNWKERERLAGASTTAEGVFNRREKEEGWCQGSLACPTACPATPSSLQPGMLVFIWRVAGPNRPCTPPIPGAWKAVPRLASPIWRRRGARSDPSFPKSRFLPRRPCLYPPRPPPAMLLIIKTPDGGPCCGELVAEAGVCTGRRGGEKRGPLARGEETRALSRCTARGPPGPGSSAHRPAPSLLPPSSRLSYKLNSPPLPLPPPTPHDRSRAMTSTRSFASASMRCARSSGSASRRLG